MNLLQAKVCVIGFLGLPAVALAGPDWLEMLDAGSFFSTAQDTTVVGAASSIAGALGPGDTEDAYLIQIDAPGFFSAVTTVTAGPFSTFDTQLWLFDVASLGLLGNDNDPGGGVGSFITTPSDDGLTFALPGAGVYLLVITEVGNVPLAAGLPIFSFASATEISGPDGPGGLLPLDGWSGSAAPGGTYLIEITVPSPGVLGLCAVAGVSFRCRRRVR